MEGFRVTPHKRGSPIALYLSRLINGPLFVSLKQNFQLCGKVSRLWIPIAVSCKVFLHVGKPLDGNFHVA